MIGLAAVVLVLAAACERGTGDLEQWVDDQLQRPGGQIEPIPPIKTAEVVTYQAYDLRDPFQRRVASAEEEVAEEGGTGLRPDPDRPREFLENFPLDTLSMVGTIELDGTDFALIRDNENVIHRVGEGDYMGTNYGRVVDVRPDRVEMVELYEDARNRWTERRTQVVMADSE
jgi:type IV pilus assembly protein PilP